MLSLALQPAATPTSTLTATLSLPLTHFQIWRIRAPSPAESKNNKKEKKLSVVSSNWSVVEDERVFLRVLKIEGQEADDAIATLAEQVFGRGSRIVIASPDKVFKQLISEDVQLVIPLPELERWSFYTLKHYIAQYDCDPQSDSSLPAVRTVGKQYVQDALTKYAFELRRNYQVLALRRDIDVQVQDEWLSKGDTTNDSFALTKLYKLIG